MQYDVIMNLRFYELEKILETYEQILENRKKAEDDEAKKQGYDPEKYKPENLQKNMPKIQIPKL